MTVYTLHAIMLMHAISLIGGPRLHDYAHAFGYTRQEISCLPRKPALQVEREAAHHQSQAARPQVDSLPNSELPS